MSKFVFRYFADCEDGQMARLETAESGIPVNIFAEDGTDFDLQDGECCKVELYGIGSQVDVYSTAEAMYAAGSKMTVPSMIPMGTFPPKDAGEPFEESAHILFVGTVLEVDTDPEANENQPNYCLKVETLEMTLQLYLRHEGLIEVGSILHGVAWLFGPVTRA